MQRVASTTTKKVVIQEPPKPEETEEQLPLPPPALPKKTKIMFSPSRQVLDGIQNIQITYDTLPFGVLLTGRLCSLGKYLKRSGGRGGMSTSR